MDSKQEYKIHFYRDEQADSTESMWAVKKDQNCYELRNSPFFVFGVSFMDLVKCKICDEQLWFDGIISHSGNSTYRIILQETHQIRSFSEAWRELKQFGCTFESMVGDGSILYTTNVPSNADIHQVYKILEKGESQGIWEFQEGHCGHRL